MLLRHTECFRRRIHYSGPNGSLTFDNIYIAMRWRSTEIIVESNLYVNYSSKLKIQRLKVDERNFFRNFNANIIHIIKKNI